MASLTSGNLAKPPMMEPIYTLLSLDMAHDDCLYRLQRQDDCQRTVVYIHLKDLTIVPEDKRTYGPDVVTELRRTIEAWNEPWTTMTVFTKDGNVHAELGSWEPHSLPPDAVSRDLPRVNIFDLRMKEHLKSRVYLVEQGPKQTRGILKFCPFSHHVASMVNELSVYNLFAKRGCDLVPRILAYVYERTKDEVIGFVCEEVKGCFAEPKDFEVCKRGLARLQSYGVIHGDLNRFNIIMTTDGPRFIDFEMATIDPDINNRESTLSKQDFVYQQNEELRGLEKALSDPEAWGQPWSIASD